MHILEIKGLNVSSGSKPILEGLSWQIPGPGLYSLMGPGGVGKSTLAKSLAHLLQKDANLLLDGTLLLQGRPISDLNKVTLIPQNHEILDSSPRRALLRALDLPINLTFDQQELASVAALELLGLESFIDLLDCHLPSLPRHEQKLIAIACALVSDDPLICVDEPTAGLTDEDAAPILALLKAHAKKRAILWISHHQRRVRENADTTALLAAGHIWSEQPTAAFFQTPANLLCQQFVRTGGYELSWPSADPESAKLKIQELSQPVPNSSAPATPPSEPLSIYQRDAQRLAAIFPELAKHYPRDSVGPQGFHWLVPGRIAGTPRPGIVLDLDLDLGALRRVGITRIISLEETLLHADAIHARGFKLVHFPIVDMEAPELERCAGLMTELDAWLSDPKERIAFHCKAGLGRTGTMLVAALVWRGMAPDEALFLARRTFNGWVQSDAQIAFLNTFAAFTKRRSRDV